MAIVVFSKIRTVTKQNCPIRHFFQSVILPKEGGPEAASNLTLLLPFCNNLIYIV